jgi:cytosine/creatinine deaminase
VGGLLQRATLTDGRVVDIRIDDEGLIAELAAALPPSPGDVVHDLSGYLLTTSFVEPHAHLDKAFLAERFDNPTGDLIGAITAMQANRHLITFDDTVERAERAVRLLHANGVTSIRSHADTTPENGLASVLALAEVRRRVAAIVDLQIVALTSWPLCGPDGTGRRALLEDALDAGADLVGGVPHLDDDPVQATEMLMEIAADHRVGMDLHTDESLNPQAVGLRTLAERVLASGFAHLVTASHCVSLGMQPADQQQATAERVAEAGISVIVLPQTNLYLQARGHTVAAPRGLTAIAALRAAGVTVAAGADNLQDPFNLVGKGDPLETAALMVMAGHMLPADAYDTVTTNAVRAVHGTPTSVTVGQPANLVAIKSASVRESIAYQPSQRLTFRRGRLSSDTRSELR